MEISYKKDFSKNYMLIKTKADINNYQMKMIMGNNIPGIIPVSVKEFNNECILYYDISGKISAINKYANKKIGNDDVKAYILGIQRLLENAKEYMLDVNKFVVDFDLVYMKINDNSPCFCYYPDKKESFSESLQAVFTNLIEMIDHNDKEAVFISYGLYQLKVEENNITVDDILHLVNDESSLEYLRSENSKGEIDKDTVAEKESQKECEWSESMLENEKNGGGMDITKSIKELKEQIKEKLIPIIKLKNNLLTKEDRYKNEEEMDLVMAESTSYNIQGSEKIGSIYEVDVEDADATVLLRANVSERGIMLKCKNIEMAQTIIPNDYPCIIGKSRKSADYIIEDKAISRVHLRIHEEMDGYYVEDLCSSNGSYINEERIKPHELKKIEIGDVVKLSDIEYVVC